MYTSGQHLPKVESQAETLPVSGGSNSNNALADGRKAKGRKVVYYLCIQFFCFFCNLIRTTRNLQWGQARAVIALKESILCIHVISSLL